MWSLYSILVLVLLVALSFLIVPFIKNPSANIKHYFVLMIIFSFCAVSIYVMSGNKTALRFWYAQGKKHYELQQQFIELGGVEGAIKRINEKLVQNPKDAQGWFILGKLYWANQNDKLAKEAFIKAYQLQPENTEMQRYYQFVLAH